MRILIAGAILIESGTIVNETHATARSRSGFLHPEPYISVTIGDLSDD
jgi:hypothetical protein